MHNICKLVSFPFNIQYKKKYEKKKRSTSRYTINNFVRACYIKINCIVIYNFSE